MSTNFPTPRASGMLTLAKNFTFQHQEFFFTNLTLNISGQSRLINVGYFMWLVN